MLEHIKRVGLELEGAFAKELANAIMRRNGYRNASWHEDSSVNVCDITGDSDEDDQENADRRDGEVVCAEPLHPEKSEIYEWMRDVWPEEWNDSCGLHVHVSFKHNNLHAYTMRDAFARAFRRWCDKAAVEHMESKELKTLWTRLSGSNTYCCVNRAGSAEKQWKGDEDRYHQLNWTAYTAHKTLECRVLPMMDLPSAVEMVWSYLQFVNRWVAKCEKRLPKAYPPVEVEKEPEGAADGSLPTIDEVEVPILRRATPICVS